MDIQTIMQLITVIVTFVCGLISKQHPKFNNKLIPVQNLLIGTIAALINFIMTKDFNASLVVSGLMTGGAYDFVKNLKELLDIKTENKEEN